MESEPAEITWDSEGVAVVYGTETEWWAEKLGTRVRQWAWNDYQGVELG